MNDICHIRPHPHVFGSAWYVFTRSGILQGFDKYGVWACGAHPVPNLQKALNLKVQ